MDAASHTHIPRSPVFTNGLSPGDKFLCFPQEISSINHCDRGLCGTSTYRCRLLHQPRSRPAGGETDGFSRCQCDHQGSGEVVVVSRDAVSRETGPRPSMTSVPPESGAASWHGQPLLYNAIAIISCATLPCLRVRAVGPNMRSYHADIW